MTDGEPLDYKVRRVNHDFMTDPARCDAPWCGEPLSSERDLSRSRGAVTCDNACAQRLSRHRRDADWRSGHVMTRDTD